MARDDGFVAGLEALAFGVLIFVVGTLIIVNAWAVVDAKFATNTAAREAVRVVVESAATGLGEATIRERARVEAARAAGSHGFAADEVVVDASLAGLCRGNDVRVEVGVQLPGMILPGVSDWGARTVTSVHTEQLDPFRSGLPC